MEFVTFCCKVKKPGSLALLSVRALNIEELLLDTLSLDRNHRVHVMVF